MACDRTTKFTSPEKLVDTFSKINCDLVDFEKYVFISSD